VITQRVITAVVLAAGLIGGIAFLPAPVLVAGLALVFLGGYWEWAGLLGYPRGPRRLPMVLAGALAMAGVYAFVIAAGHSAIPFLLVAAVWWLCAFAWVLAYPTPVPRVVIVGAAFFVLLLAWLALTTLLLRVPDGGSWLLAAFVLVWAADTGAYFVGRRFGRHKLAPAVSPGKTWEGVAGGMALALVAAVFIAMALKVRPVPFMALALLVAAVSVVGDLTVSLFKRNAGIKDSGRLFPGHGGILDRLDSVCAAAPLLALGISLPELWA
jgi:phosphatidate cytidylyltransferase